MGLKPRTPNEGQPDQAYVSTITAEDLAAYAEYADGYESDEEEAEEKRPQRPNFALKLSSAVRNFSLPSPEEIKVISLYICIWLYSKCFCNHIFYFRTQTL